MMDRRRRRRRRWDWPREAGDEGGWVAGWRGQERAAPHRTYGGSSGSPSGPPAPQRRATAGDLAPGSGRTRVQA
ncbi:unnamed protein product, partial [Prorocentrum cordatum]